MKTTVITFEDHGQDFLTFKVKSDGEIIDVKPFQFSIWSEYKVINLNELYINGFVKLVKIKGKSRCSALTIKYPIENIE